MGISKLDSSLFLGGWGWELDGFLFLGGGGWGGGGGGSRIIRLGGKFTGLGGKFPTPGLIPACICHIHCTLKLHGRWGE